GHLRHAPRESPQSHRRDRPEILSLGHVVQQSVVRVPRTPGLDPPRGPTRGERGLRGGGPRPCGGGDASSSLTRRVAEAFSTNETTPGRWALGPLCTHPTALAKYALTSLYIAQRG